MSEDSHDQTTMAQFAVGSAALAADSLFQLTRGSARIVRRLGNRGGKAVTDSRDAAVAALHGSVDNSINWVATTVAPKVIDKMLPYLVNSVVPRVIDGAMPYIRTRVLPVIINDLTHDPEVREMISEQGRGVLTDATMQLRETSATADDRVETGFRKVFHLPQTQS